MKRPNGWKAGSYVRRTGDDHQPIKDEDGNECLPAKGAMTPSGRLIVHKVRGSWHVGHVATGALVVELPCDWQAYGLAGDLDGYDWPDPDWSPENWPDLKNPVYSGFVAKVREALSKWRGMREPPAVKDEGLKVTWRAIGSGWASAIVAENRRYPYRSLGTLVLIARVAGMWDRVRLKIASKGYRPGSNLNLEPMVIHEAQTLADAKAKCEHTASTLLARWRDKERQRIEKEIREGVTV